MEKTRRFLIKSFPNLELEAAVLGVRLQQTVRKTFSCISQLWSLDRQFCCFGLDTATEQKTLELCRPQRKRNFTFWLARMEIRSNQTKPCRSRALVVSNRKKFPPNGSKVHLSSTNQPKICPNDRKQHVQPSFLIKHQSFLTLYDSLPGATYWKSPPTFSASFCRLRAPTSPSSLISEVFRKTNHALIKHLSLCLLPLLSINCVETWIWPRGTNSNFLDRLSTKFHYCALMATSYTHRSLKQFVRL